MEIHKTHNTLGKLIVKSTEEVTFNPHEMETWTKLFNELRDEGKIKGNFEDREWRLPCSISDLDKGFVFDLDIYKNANVFLKAFVLVEKKRGLSTASIYAELLFSKRFILESEYFTNEIRLEEHLSSESNRGIPNQTSKYIKTVLKLLDFQNVNKGEILKDILYKYLPLYKQQNRDLPNFDDVLVFDEIVNHYFKSYSPEQTLKFSPVLIWWLLTNIIPLRPSALFLLEADCLEIDSKGLYWINIRRIKNRYVSNSEDKKFLTFQIDKKTFEMLQKYKNQIQGIDPDTIWYFPRSLYSKFKPKSNEFNIDRDRITYQEFYRLLREFYSEVVQGCIC